MKGRKEHEHNKVTVKKMVTKCDYFSFIQLPIE